MKKQSVIVRLMKEKDVNKIRWWLEEYNPDSRLAVRAISQWLTRGSADGNEEGGK
jgi:hypothetical protein